MFWKVSAQKISSSRALMLKALLGFVTLSWFQTVGCSIGGGSDDDSQQGEAGDLPPIRSSSPIADGQTPFSFGRLPTLKMLMETNDTRQGVLVSRLTSSALEFAVTGSLNDHLKDQREALSTKYWTVVLDKGKSFRDGLESCRMLETMGNSLSSFYQMNRVFCSLRFAEAGNFLKKVSGDELESGAIFKPTTTDIIRVVEIGSDSSKLDLFSASKIVINLKSIGNSVFDWDISLCSSDKKNLGKMTVRTDLKSKIFTIQHQLSLDPDRGQTGSKRNSIGSLTGSWKSPGAELVVDEDAPRSFQWHQSWENADGKKNIYKGNLSSQGGILFLKGFDQKSDSPWLRKRRYVAAFRVQALGSQSFSLSDAEMKADYLFTDSDSQDLRHKIHTAMTYDSSKEFGFKVSTPGEKLIADVSFDSDSLLNQTEIESPTLSPLSDEACTAQPKSTYRISLPQAQFDEIEKSCNLNYYSLTELCEHIEYDEGEVLRALKASPKGIP